MRIDYDIVQGDTLFIDIQPTDDADAAFDLSGFTAEVAVEYVNAAGVKTIWSAVSPSGVTISAEGIISCAVPSSETALIPADRRVSWQLRLTDPAGAKQTLVEGLVRVRNSSLI